MICTVTSSVTSSKSKKASLGYAGIEDLAVQLMNVNLAASMPQRIKVVLKANAGLPSISKVYLIKHPLSICMY